MSASVSQKTTFPPACDPTPEIFPGTTLGDLACLLSGSLTPFGPATLGFLYPSHQDYVDAVEADASRLMSEGFLLNRDRFEIVDRAEAADIP